MCIRDRVDVANHTLGVVCELGGGVHLDRVGNINQMVRNAALLFGPQLVGADVRSAIDGRRITVDDLDAIALGQRQTQRALPRSSRPQHGQDTWMHFSCLLYTSPSPRDS